MAVVLHAEALEASIMDTHWDGLAVAHVLELVDATHVKVMDIL